MRRILSFELKFARNKLLIRKHESRVFEALAPIILLEIWAPTLSAYAKGLVGGRLLDVMVIPSINDKILRTENVKTSLASTMPMIQNYFKNLMPICQASLCQVGPTSLLLFAEFTSSASVCAPHATIGPDNRKGRLSAPASLH